jgi:hypothetical protein
MISFYLNSSCYNILTYNNLDVKLITIKSIIFLFNQQLRIIFRLNRLNFARKWKMKN